MRYPDLADEEIERVKDAISNALGNMKRVGI